MIFSKSISKLKIVSFIILVCFSFLPPLLKEVFVFSSYTQGFLIAILISLLINKYKIYNKKEYFFNKIFIWTFIVFFFYTFLLIVKKLLYNEDFDILKFILFLPFFSGLLISSKKFSELLIRLKDRQLLSIINIFIIVMVIGGLFAIFGYSVYGPITMRKPTFVYSEVSHYALGIGPFLAYILIVNKSFYFKILIISSLFLIGFFVESLSLLLTILFAIFPLINSRSFKYLFILASIIFMVFFGGEYFIERLSLLPNNSNETNWVYLQGIEEALLSLESTNGLGLGPQQLGFDDPKGSFAQLIYDNSGVYINRYDGSVAFTKIVSEFGIVGISLCLLYLYLFINSYNYLTNLEYNIQQSHYLIMSHSFIYMFFIYMFIRGGGYFGPNFFYFFVGIFCIYYFKNKSNSYLEYIK